MELWIVFILINPFSFPGKGEKKNSKCTLFQKNFFVLNVENEKQNPVKGAFYFIFLITLFGTLSCDGGINDK